MNRVALGNSGLVVSRVGLGTVKLGRLAGLKYPQGQMPARLPTDDEAITLLTAARDLGVTLVDTAPAYGSSERRLGELLPRVAPRDRWVISTKVGESFDGSGSSYDFSPSAIDRSIARSLTDLRTDHIDILLLHGSGAVDDTAMLAPPTVAALVDAKRRGLVRAVGASLSLASPLDPQRLDGLDVIMVTLNASERQSEPIIAAARARGLGVLVKKPLESGQARPGSLSAVLAHPGVHAAVVGTSSPAHLAQAAGCVNGDSATLG